MTMYSQVDLLNLTMTNLRLCGVDLKRRIQRLESKLLSTHLDILALLKSLSVQALYTSYKEQWGIQV